MVTIEAEKATLTLVHFINIDGERQTSLRYGNLVFAEYPVKEIDELRDPTLSCWVEVSVDDFEIPQSPDGSSKWATRQMENARKAVRHFARRSSAVTSALERFVASIPDPLIAVRDRHFHYTTELDWPSQATIDVYAYFRRAARGKKVIAGADTVKQFIKTLPIVMKSLEKQVHPASRDK